MATMLPRSKLSQVYVAKICKEHPSESSMDIYEKFNLALWKRKPVIYIQYKPLAIAVKKWIMLGERLKTLGVSMSLSSLVLSNLGWCKLSLALASGGYVVQSFYSFGWSRDAISRYILQPLENKPINEDAVLEEAVVLVTKSKTGSNILRGALTFSAVAMSAYLLWKSLK